MYDNPHMDSYLSDEQDPDLGGGLGSIHAFGGMGLGDDMDNDEKALLGPAKRGKVGSLPNQCSKLSPILQPSQWIAVDLHRTVLRWNVEPHKPSTLCVMHPNQQRGLHSTGMSLS